MSRAGNESDVKHAVAAGVEVVQYRAKEIGTKEMYEEALRLRRICKGIIFLVNDRVDIALAVNADGVHIGKEDMPYSLARKLLGRRKIIGVTAHNVSEAKEAQKLGADYIGVSPVFKTTTKTDAGPAAGVGLIRKVKKYVSIPAVAIGGITLSNAKEVVRAGADAICAISTVVTKRNVKKEVEKFQRLFRKAPPKTR